MNNTTAPLTISYDAIMTQLLALNLQTRARINRHHCGMTPPVFASELCTISVDAGRQNGKTSWILRNVASDDIVIVVNKEMRTALLQMAPTLNPERIFTAQDVLMAQSNDEHSPAFSRCFIDSATHVFIRVLRKHLYRWAVPDDDEIEHTFFLLG